jgi:hypothetical protein
VTDLDIWTQARHLRELDAMARDLIAGHLDVPADSLSLDVEVITPVDAAEHLARSAALAAQADQARADSAAEVRVAARLMHEAGMPMRDVGAILGVSHQRAHQLISARG